MNPDAFDRDMAQRWHLYRPPARPSPGDIEIYRSFMREPGRTLLLGSTPELRSLAHEHGHQLTAVDRHEGVYRALESLVSPRGPERFCGGDWLEMALDETFDLVVADGSINMIPSHRHAQLIERIASHVRPGGLVLLRAYILGEPQIGSAEEVFSLMRGSADHVYTATKLHLSVLWVNRATGEISNADYWTRIQELHGRGAITGEEFGALREILADDTLSLFMLDRSAFEAKITPDFELLEVRLAGDYERHELKPIFCLRRR